MRFCVYRFLNKDGEIIYVGKTQNLHSRVSGHSHLPKACYEESVKIEFCEFNTEYDMDFAERYFIPKYNPMYNTMLAEKELTLKIEVLDNMNWCEYVQVQRLERTTSNAGIVAGSSYDEWYRGVKDRCEDIETAIFELNKEREEILYRKATKKIVVICTGEIYTSAHEASKIYNLSVQEIVENCEGRLFLNAKHPKYHGCWLSFSYYEDYNFKTMASTIEKYTRGVTLLNSGKSYVNVVEAEEISKVKQIRRCCRGISNYCGTSNGQPLIWMWSDKYAKMSRKEIQEIKNRAMKIYVTRSGSKLQMA